jgi:hypothetical protein
MTTRRTYGTAKTLFFVAVMIATPVGLIAATYLATTLYRTLPLYRYVKNHERGWAGKVHQADDELGFAPVPNARGAHTFPIGPDVPMRYDGDGFRVPLTASDNDRARHPVVLALGCSNTYGDAILAEEAYPFVVGARLGGTARNAGVCSYGLAQMLILARRYLPTMRPDYVIVQYSSWLASRAASPFAPTYFGRLPVPFFLDTPEMALHSPVFRTKAFDLPVDTYQRPQRGVQEAGSFWWRVGLPLFWHDDTRMTFYTLKRLLGAIPATAGTDAIERFVYAEIGAVARRTGSRLIVVLLGFNTEPVRVSRDVFPKDAVVVDATEALVGNLSVGTDDEYLAQYAIWRGSPAVVVDRHPNPKAHRIIAEAVLDGIQRSAPHEAQAATGLLP